jgi:hypothetical protein
VLNEQFYSLPKFLRVYGFENPLVIQIQARGYDSQRASRGLLVPEKVFRGELEQEIKRKVSLSSSAKSLYLLLKVFFDYEFYFFKVKPSVSQKSLNF